MTEKKIDIPRKQRKERFCVQYNIIKNKYHLSDSQSAEILGCSISTFKDSINPKNSYCNSDLLISFCHKYGDELGIDINYLYYGEEPKNLDLSKPGSATILASLGENIQHPYDFAELNDPAYMGTFYGYCRNSQYDKIDSFILDIFNDDDGASKAELKMVSASLSPTGNSRKVEKVLYGKPMLLKNTLVHIEFHSAQGNDMYTLDYKWISINSNGKNKRIHCANGALLTINRGIDKYPEQQAFIIVNRPVNPKNMHFIDGYLKLAQDEIIVPAKALTNPENGLLNCNESVKEFFKNSPQINILNQEVYCFSEKMLLAAGEANNIDIFTTAKAILYLKEHSINPKKIDHPIIKEYSKFISSLCLDE